MRRFLIRTLIFFTIAAAMVYVVYRLVIVGRERFFAMTGVETVFFGNSTIEYGINDTVIPNSLNLGLNADHLEYIYAKLQLLHRNTPTLRNVVLGFDNTLLFKDTSGEHYAQINHPFYYDCYDWSDIKAILEYSDYKWWQNYLTQPMSMVKVSAPLRMLIDGNVDIHRLGIGMYERLYQTMETVACPDTVSYNTSLMDCDFDNRLSLYFLDRIHDYAQKNNLKLIFLTMPNYVIENVDTSYRCIRHMYYEDVPHIDLFQDSLPSTMFRDSAHLNAWGSDTVSLQVRGILRNILSETN